MRARSDAEVAMQFKAKPMQLDLKGFQPRHFSVLRSNGNVNGWAVFCDIEANSPHCTLLPRQMRQAVQLTYLFNTFAYGDWGLYADFAGSFGHRGAFVGSG